MFQHGSRSLSWQPVCEKWKIWKRYCRYSFAVYSQMDQKDKEDPTKIWAALLAVFAMSPFQAYEEFRVRICGEG